MDFILGRGEVAVEVKGATQVGNADTRALRAFIQEHHPRKAILVCNERAARASEGIVILPWREFLRMLWDGAIIS